MTGREEEGRIWKMRKKIRRMTAYLLLGAMMLLQGCRGTDMDAAQQQGNETNGTSPGTADESGTGEQTMGRYLEQEITLPEDVTEVSYPTLCLQKLATGELMLIEKTAGVYVSEDNGESWNRKEAPWLRELRERYVSDMAIGPDGSVALVYILSMEEEGQEDNYRSVGLYVDPEGNPTVLESPDEEALYRFSFGNDGQLYGCTMGRRMYEMDPVNKETAKLYETDGLSDYVCFAKSCIIDITSRGLVFYDMENMMPADDDQVLQDFIMENVGDGIGSNSGSHEVVMVPGEEEDVVYFACKGGLYRHAIGGAAVEQVVEGDLSSLGDPMMSLAGMAALPDNEFVILYTNGKLYRYVYDPDIPTVPEEQVSIYSLTENYAVRQSVSLFQKQHPEVYVRYEVGLNAGSGMTSEDAVKNLNTRIMSGSGPDLLVLDGLPRKSYEEKGVLLDLSEIADGMSGEDALFPSLVEACREDGNLYYLPLRFRLPLLVGDPEVLEKVTDLAGLADIVEEMRKENPEGRLTGLTAEGKALRTLGINCSGSWIDSKTGEIDQERLKDFLIQAKRIYQAEISGIGEEEQAEYKRYYENSMALNGATEYFADASNGALNIAMGEQKIGIGIVRMLDGDFNMISTLVNQETDLGFGSWQAQIQNGFLPKGMIGLCSGSQDDGLAQEFFRFLYGREMQDIELPTGLPVNMASFEQLKENPRADDMGISIGTSGADGSSFNLDIRWSTEEDFETLKGMAESASTVCAGDAVVEEIVYEVGQKVLNGSVSADDAVAEIVKKAAIYLAE